MPPKSFFARLQRFVMGKAPRRRKPVPAELLPGVVNHDALRAADPHAFKATHRRMAWLLRLAAMIIVGQFGVIITMSSAISALIPLQKLTMGLIRIEQRSDRAEKVDPASLVQVLPITKDTPGFDLLMETFVRRYTRILLEIDPVSQGDRMREANMYSDSDWWKKFTSEHVKEIDKALGTGLDRSVVVESADRISMRNGIYHYAVDIVQIDKRDGKTIQSLKLRAYLAVVSRPHTVRESEQYENALGLRVLDVSLKERGNS